MLVDFSIDISFLIVIKMLMVDDITERNQTEETLRDANQFNIEIVSQAGEGIIVYDRDLRYVVWNGFMERMTGALAEDVIGQNALDLFPHLYEQGVDKLLKRALNGETVASPDIPFYSIFTDKKGWVVGTYSPHRNARGEIIGVIAILIDITERKRAEEALQESETLQRTLLASLPAGVIIVDPKTRVIEKVNDAASALFGAPMEYIVGHRCHAFLCPASEGACPICDLRKEVDNAEKEMLCADGSRCPVLKSVKRVQIHGQEKLLECFLDITDRKKAEEALRRSEEHLRLAVEGGELGTYTYDFISGQSDWSPELKAFYGLRNDEPLVLDEDGVAKALHPEDRSAFLSAMIAANDPYGVVDGILELDYRIIRADGSIRWLRVHGRTEFIGESNNRRPWRAAGVVTDNTERKKAVDALKESRTRHELAIQSAQMGSWVLDVVENKRDFDAQTCHLLGIDRATFKGSPDEFFRVVHPDDRDAIQAALTRSIEHDAPYESAYRVIHPDGSIRHIVSRGRVIRGQNRRPLKLIGIIWDYTEHKQAEEALRTSHQILDGIINAIPVRVFWKDKDLVYLGCNAIFALDAGFADSKDIVGKDDYQMGWHDQAELYRADDRQVIESGRSKLLIEEPQTTPEGNTIVLLTSKMPLRSSEGEIIGVLGTYMDITERKQMESELLRSRDELEFRVKERTEELARKNAEMERFIYAVSHDLRTPLISMSGFLGFLKQDAEKGDMKRVDEDFRIVSGAITKMDKLLQDTLELSRIGRIVNPPENVPFGEIIIEALEQSSAKLSSKNIKVTVDEDLPIVQVDRMRLVEVLVNLLENSVKYMGDQPQPEIEIGKRLDGENTVFFVRDNGIGIEPSQHDRVFELFYKVDKKSDGSGAGLAIVKKIIEVHGGRIWIESELGKGCTVCFTLEPANPG